MQAASIMAEKDWSETTRARGGELRSSHAKQNDFSFRVFAVVTGVNRVVNWSEARRVHARRTAAMPTDHEQSIDQYPRVVKLHHGKKFKLGLDFDDVPGIGVVVAMVHPGYPAMASGLIAAGDVVSDVNGTAPRDVPHILELCLCKGGRGTDEFVLLNLSQNQSEALKAHALKAYMEQGPAKPQSAPGFVHKVVRTLSFNTRRRSSTGSTSSRASQQRDLWTD